MCSQKENVQLWVFLLSKSQDFLMDPRINRPPRTEIIIMMSCSQHEFPSPSHTTILYHSSLPVGLPGYILYRHRTAVDKYYLAVQPLLVHVRGPKNYIVYEFILTSSAVSYLSGLSNLDGFRNGW